MSLVTTQTEITVWGQETFDQPTALALAVRDQQETVLENKSGRFLPEQGIIS